MSGGKIKRRVVTALRVKDGLSMRQLAKKAGISGSYLSKIEAGEKNGTPTLALRLANAFGVPIEALWSPGEDSDVSLYVLEITGDGNG